MLQSNKFGFKISGLLFFCALILLNSACEPAPSMINKATPAPVEEVAEKLNDVQREVKDMQEAGFDIIYVLKRKDGGVFDKEDKQYLKANSPDINRRVLTGDEKVFIAGSNYQFTPENLEALRKRFIFEDYSKPGIQQPTPAGNTNQAPKNTNSQKNVSKRVSL